MPHLLVRRASPVILLPALSAMPLFCAQAYVSACCGAAGSISALQTSTHQVARTFATPKGAVAMVSNAAGTRLYVATSHRPQFFALGGGEDALWVLSPASGNVLHKVPLTGGPGAIAINPLGDHVYLTITSAAGSPSLVAVDLANLTTTIAVIPNPTFVNYYPLALSIDGGTVFVAGSLHLQDGVARTLLEYDAATLKVTGKVILTAATNAAPAPTPDGKRLVVATNINYVDIIDVAANKVTASIPFGSNSSAEGVVISPDGNTAYVNASVLAAIDIPSATIKGFAATNLNDPFHLVITPDGSTLYAGDMTYNQDLPGGHTGPLLSVVDAASLTVKRTIPTLGPPLALALGPAAIYVLNQDSSYAVEVDTTAMRAVSNTKVGAGPGQQLFVPGLDFVFCEGNLSAIKLAGADSPTVTPVLLPGINPIFAGSMALLNRVVYVSAGSGLQTVDLNTLVVSGTINIPLPKLSFLNAVTSSVAAGILDATYFTYGGDGSAVGGGLVQYNPQTKQQTYIDSTPFVGGPVVAAADGKLAFAIGSSQAAIPFDEVTRFSTATGARTAKFAGADYVALQLSHDGKTLYVADRLGKVDFLDSATLKLTGSLPVGIKPNGIAVSPDGSEALVTDQTSNSLSVIDLNGRTVRGTIPIGTPSTGVTYIQ